MCVAVLVSHEVVGCDLIRAEMIKVQDGASQFGRGLQGASGQSDAEKGASAARTAARAPMTEQQACMPIDACICDANALTLGYVLLGKSQIESIQKRFKKDIIFSGAANGQITQEFLVALRTFQTAKGVQANGVIDLKSLAAMEGDCGISIELTKKLDTMRACRPALNARSC